MSRTKRQILSHSQEDYFGNIFIDVVDDSAAKHRKVQVHANRLKPYIKMHLGMYIGKNKEEIGDTYSYTFRTNVRSRTGHGARMRVNNINRSMKKGLRQQYKKDIRRELENLF